jgi:hypothetical protein
MNLSISKSLELIKLLNHGSLQCDLADQGCNTEYSTSSMQEYGWRILVFTSQVVGFQERKSICEISAIARYGNRSQNSLPKRAKISGLAHTFINAQRGGVSYSSVQSYIHRSVP